MSPTMTTPAVAAFAHENVKAVWDEIMPLLHENHADTALYKDIPLDPDKNVYLSFDLAGFLRVYTARIEGVLVGYAVFVVTPNHRYRSMLVAQQDVFFVKKENRGFGPAFVRWCDARLVEAGVTCIARSTVPKYDFSPLLGRMGYEIAETSYWRRVR